MTATGDGSGVWETVNGEWEMCYLEVKGERKKVKGLGIWETVNVKCNFLDMKAQIIQIVTDFF